MNKRWKDTGAPWTARERAAYRKGAEKAEARLGAEIKRLNERIAEMETNLPDGATLPNGMKNQTSSAGRFMGKSVIYGKEDEHATPYMTRYWIGRLRLHIFHRGDQDPDCHDHPWDFWTFPLTPYVEEVAEPTGWGEYEANGNTYSYPLDSDEARFSPLAFAPIVTFVWRSKDKRKWGFLKHRDGKWCWVHWKDYVFGGGKSAPCE